MTPCRPETPQPRCSYCERRNIPLTVYRGSKGQMRLGERIDPTAVLKAGQACPLYARVLEAV